MGVGGQRHAPAASPPGKRPGIHCIGGSVGPRACLDGCEKYRPHWDSITGQPVASRYTDWAIAVHTLQGYSHISVINDARPMFVVETSTSQTAQLNSNNA